MTIFVANVTKQNQTIHHSVADRHSVDIAAGEQIEIGATWTPSEIAAFIDHLETFGGREVETATRDDLNFSGLLYREGGPITEAEIKQLHIVAGYAARGAQRFSRGSGHG